MHETEFDNRLVKAWKKFHIYRENLCDKVHSLKKRLRLFDSVITPTVLYGCGTWALTAKQRQRLRTNQRRMLRRVVGKPWTVTDDDDTTIGDFSTWIRGTTHQLQDRMGNRQVTDWMQEQLKRKWKWAKDCARRTHNRWTTKLLNLTLEQNRPRGRPCLRWSDDIQKCCEVQGHYFG